MYDWSDKDIEYNMYPSIATKAVCWDTSSEGNSCLGEVKWMDYDETTNTPTPW